MGRPRDASKPTTPWETPPPDPRPTPSIEPGTVCTPRKPATQAVPGAAGRSSPRGSGAGALPLRRVAEDLVVPALLGCACELDHHVLDLGVLVERVGRHVLAEARLLEPAVRCVGG